MIILTLFFYFFRFRLRAVEFHDEINNYAEQRRHETPHGAKRSIVEIISNSRCKDDGESKDPYQRKAGGQRRNDHSNQVNHFRNIIIQIRWKNIRAVLQTMAHNMYRQRMSRNCNNIEQQKQNSDRQGTPNPSPSCCMRLHHSQRQRHPNRPNHKRNEQKNDFRKRMQERVHHFMLDRNPH